MERAFSAGDLLTNGPWPLTAPQMANAATRRRQVLVPLGPNRIAAQSRKGNGAYTDAGAVAERTPTPPNTTTHTVKRPTTNTPASRQRRADAPRKIGLLALAQLTMTGTRVSEAKTLDGVRVNHMSQYPACP